MINKAYLLTGSNMGNRLENLEKARLLIVENAGELIAVSSIYETAPWGNPNQPLFLNQALEISTILSVKQLLRCILKIEKQMGRVRGEKYAPRIIDIDILLFNDKEFNYPMLKIPHPEMQYRRFALTALAEIAGDVIHPTLQVSINQLLKECADVLEVKKYS